MLIGGNNMDPTLTIIIVGIIAVALVGIVFSFGKAKK